MSNMPRPAAMPAVPNDVRVCVPGVIVRMKDSDQWDPFGAVPGNGTVLGWQVDNMNRNGVQVEFENVGKLFVGVNEIELVDCPTTRSVLVENILGGDISKP